MKTIRLIINNTKIVLTSAGFYGSVTMMIILCFTSELFSDSSANKGYSVINVLLNTDRKTMLGDIKYCSYYAISNCTDGFLPIFIPIIVAFPFIPALCNEREAKFKRYTIYRLSKASYNTGTYISAMLSGGAAILLGFIVYTFIVSKAFPNIDDYSLERSESLRATLKFFYPNVDNIGVLYVFKGIELFLFGAISVLPALFLSSFIKNKYLIICIPFLLKYLLLQYYLKLRYIAYEDITNPNHKLNTFLDITHPNSMMTIFSQGDMRPKILIFVFLELILSFALYCLTTNRRLDNGE